MDLSLMVFRATRFTIDCQMSCKGNGIDRQTIESVNRQVMAAHQTSGKNASSPALDQVFVLRRH